MAQEYTVSNWQPWEDEEGPVRDKFGNYKGSVWFDEDTRQVDATSKAEPQKGDTKYGDIVEYKTRSGKTRLKFQRADRPQEGNYGTYTSNSGGGKSNYVPRDDNAIRAQWAIGQAVQLVNAEKVAYGEDSIELAAKQLYAMVDRVKESNKLKADDTTDDEWASLNRTLETVNVED